MEGEGGEEARDQAYQAEDREDWDQAYQANREDAPDCAYCTVGGVMHAYQAYRADGKFEAVMDSGANINIFTDELENGLTNARQSRISVGGFTGASVRASKDGTAHMYVFDPSDPSTGKHISVPATTMKGGANSNLISAWHLVKQCGFTCTLSPTGFEGFSRKEPDGSITRLPSVADKRKRLWIMHFTISADAADSKRQAIQRHASLMCREMSDDHTAVAYTAGFIRMCGAGDELHDNRAIEMIVDHVNAGDEVLQIASGLRSKLSRRDLQGLQSVCLAGFDDSTLNTGIDVDNGDGFGTDDFSVRAHADDDDRNVHDVDGNGDGLINMEDDILYKEAEPVITPSQRPGDKKLQQRIRHFKLGHHGPCPGGCDICKQTSGTLRRVFKSGTPVYDTVPGRTFNMDSIYWDVESRWGNKYTVVMRDECTLFPCGFHLEKRSDAITEFRKFILKMRADPELRCPDFCKRLRIDDAGEWSSKYVEWIKVCDELGIERIQPPSKSDHRMMTGAENAVMLTKLHTQRILLSTRLEWDMWEEACNFGWYVRQHNVVTRKASPQGRGPAPITELSCNNVDDYECDRRKEYAWPPGTLALVHDPGKHGGAKNVTHARYGRVIMMEKGIPTFEALRDRATTFRSKNFSVVHLHEGISALQWAGIESKRLPKACVPEVELSRFVTCVELSKLTTANEGRLPIVKGVSKQGDAPLPGVVTFEKGTGRIWQEKDGVLHPTDGHVEIVPPGFSNELTEATRVERAIARLVSQPESWIGQESHRLFEEYGGVYRGTVTSYDDETKYWRVKYSTDNESEEYDVEDMTSYVIKLIHGRAPPDGGAAQWIKHCKATQLSAAGDASPDMEPEPEAGLPLVDGFDGQWYTTINNDNWRSVCTAVGISTDQQLMYFKWLKEYFKIGNDKARCTTLFFPNQINKTKKLVKFDAGQFFPRPEGSLWDTHVREFTMDVDGAHTPSAADHAEAAAAAIVADLEQHAEALARQAHEEFKSRQDGADWYERICSYALLEQETDELYDGPDWVNWTAVANQAKKLAGQPTDDRGMPIAPKSMKELESWADTTLWDEAISKEWDGLNDRDCFEHDLTLKDARQRHSKLNGDAKFKIVGMRMLLEAKIVDGKFNKAKARNVAQGHKGSLTKGVDYTTVFAAAPDLATGRIIQALSVLFSGVRVTMDIMQAYLIGKAEEDQQYTVRYPEGRIREEHRDPTTGEERYAILVGNLYGMPTASRVFSKERDRLLLEVLPKHHPGVTVQQMEYEPCLFIIKRKSIGYVSIHVDDCDGFFLSAEDGAWWTDATNNLFKTENQPGIKVVDPEHMLGVTRVMSELPDGTKIMRLTQIAYVEQVWAEFGHFRKGKRKPSTPMPGKGDSSPPPLDENEKPVGVTDQEARDVHALGYRKLVGELLWPMRNTSPAIAAAMSILSKCVHRPSMGAWLAALHCMHFLYEHRHEGITFRSDGNVKPVCFYDSGFYQDLIGHKPQYGYVIYWAGGPLIWRSKKHTNIPLHTSEAEYMTITHAFRHVKWLRSLLTEMGFGWMVDDPTEMYGDNRNATDWAVEKMVSDGNRHIDICFMKIRERVRMGEIKPVWIEGKKNPSDILTKAVEKAVIDTLMGQLTGREAIEGLTLRDVAKDGQEFETVDALVAEIYADIVKDFEMGNFGSEERTVQVKL